MPTYIAILRGINVSGQKKIRMAELRAALGELPLGNIRTYIQSGNILFEHPGCPTGELEQLIKQSILQNFGFDVPTIIKSASEFEAIRDNNPFVTPDRDLKRLYVTFLSSLPEPARAESLTESDYSPEECVVDGGVVYLYSPQGYGRAKMNNNFFEKKLGVSATTRNWKTVNKLLQLAFGQD